MKSSTLYTCRAAFIYKLQSTGAITAERAHEKSVLGGFLRLTFTVTVIEGKTNMGFPIF